MVINSNTELTELILIKATALANKNRIQIIELLKNPSQYFSKNELSPDGGVCGLDIAIKLAISTPTVSSHLKILTQSGFLSSSRSGKYTYFKITQTSLKEFSMLIEQLNS